MMEQSLPRGNAEGCGITRISAEYAIICIAFREKMQ